MTDTILIPVDQAKLILEALEQVLGIHNRTNFSKWDLLSVASSLRVLLNDQIFDPPTSEKSND